MRSRGGRCRPETSATAVTAGVILSHIASGFVNSVAADIRIREHRAVTSDEVPVCAALNPEITHHCAGLTHIVPLSVTGGLNPLLNSHRAVSLQEVPRTVTLYPLICGHSTVTVGEVPLAVCREPTGCHFAVRIGVEPTLLVCAEYPTIYGSLPVLVILPSVRIYPVACKCCGCHHARHCERRKCRLKLLHVFVLLFC